MATTFQFSDALREYFGAEIGAYSQVTQTENKDGQLTIASYEKTIVQDYFGPELKKIYGSKAQIMASGNDYEKQFRKFPSGELIALPLVYKDARVSELRLYLRAEIFKPIPLDYWGVFVRTGEIWICHFSSWMLARIESGALGQGNRFQLLEPDDDGFQDIINGTPPSQITSLITKWKRDPLLASKVLAAKNYTCEIYPNLPTFRSKSSGNTYQEAHHLVPMNQQTNLTENLDAMDNICILGPFAHRRIHYASFDLILPDLRRLVSTRGALLERLGILEDDILGFYNR
jgi:5-methylcytosine-specific restriction enzyme A